MYITTMQSIFFFSNLKIILLKELYHVIGSNSEFRIFLALQTRGHMYPTPVQGALPAICTTPTHGTAQSLYSARLMERCT